MITLLTYGRAEVTNQAPSSRGADLLLLALWTYPNAQPRWVDPHCTILCQCAHFQSEIGWKWRQDSQGHAVWPGKCHHHYYRQVLLLEISNVHKHPHKSLTAPAGFECSGDNRETLKTRSYTFSMEMTEVTWPSQDFPGWHTKATLHGQRGEPR